MPWFEYEGLTPGGSAVRGQLEAPDREQAMIDLAQMQIDIRDLRSAVSPPRRLAGLNESDLIFFNEQLASLAQAGMALDEGLAQLARDVDSPRLKRWIAGLVEDLRRGATIDQAIAAREQGLPILYSRVIRAGIETGELPATLLNLNQHLRLVGQTRRLIWEAASYPLLVLVMALTVFSAFFVLVVPKFRDIFADFGTQLPFLTVLALDLADRFPQVLAALLGLVGCAILFWHSLLYFQTGRALRDSILLGVPVLGRMHRASLVARFLRSVAMALGSGVGLPSALRLAAGATGSSALNRDAEHLAGEVERGESIFVANRSTRIIPPLFGYCVEAAAGRGALPSAIAELASSYENRAVYAQNVLRVTMFPLTILIVGGFLLFAVTSMFLPLVHLINAVSG